MMNYRIVMTNNSLSHHGILGQKWGVRRFQNKDGSLTPEGEKRYNTGETKGKYEKYKQMGLTKEDQFTAEYNSDKIKKALLIGGGIVLTAGAVYAGKRYMQNNVDKIVKSGAKLQTIMDKDTIDTGRAFYTSLNGLDNLRYGAIGAQLGYGNNNVYNHVMEAKKDFKIASPKSAEKVFSKLMEDDKDFAKIIKDTTLGLEQYSQLDPVHAKVIRKAVKEVKNGNIGINTYELFNINLASRGHSDEIKNKFYDAMKKTGYAGIKDINDMKYTNYRSISPSIIFDGEKVIKNNVKVSELTEKHFKTGFNIVIAQGIAKVSAPFVAGVGVNKAVKNTKKSISDPKKVAKYREEHPNSKKTYSEILKILEKK